MFHAGRDSAQRGGAVGSSGLGSQQSNDRLRTDQLVTPIHRAFRCINTITTTDNGIKRRSNEVFSSGVCPLRRLMAFDPATGGRDVAHAQLASMLWEASAPLEWKVYRPLVTLQTATDTTPRVVP
jgi:hypothetical protein